LSLALWERGVYVRCGGDTLQFAPPYISTPEEIDRLFAITAEVLEEAV
jgi:beta-alanine--pyruvate transaminase